TSSAACGVAEVDATPQAAEGKWRWLLAAYVALAVGLLLKGPIAVVLPAAVLMVQRLIDRRLSWSWGRELGLPWGVPLTLALALPWYLWVDHQTHGELFRVFFWY